MILNVTLSVVSNLQKKNYCENVTLCMVFNSSHYRKEEVYVSWVWVETSEYQFLVQGKERVDFEN